MTRRLALAGAGALSICSIACQSIAGLGDFAPAGGDGGAGQATGGGGSAERSSQAAGGGGTGAGEGGAPLTSTTTTSTSTSTTSATSSASTGATTSSTGGGCTLDHLVISEVRTRGPDDGNQDFIELFNPTSSPIIVSDSLHVDARGESSSTYAARYTGDASVVIGAGERFLLVNDEPDNPIGDAIADGFYDAGVPDGASVVLYDGGVVVDAVCFTCDEASLDATYVCEGAPLIRSASCGAGGDVSVQRKTSSGTAGCVDTGDSSADLEEGPSSPEGTNG